MENDTLNGSSALKRWRGIDVYGILMMKVCWLIIIFFAARNGWALNPHPRLWLTPSLLSTITAKASSGDADWLKLVSDANTLKTYPVPAYDRTACASHTICYAYEGYGWEDAIVKLALVYRITGDATYAVNAKAILAAANAPYKASGDLSPFIVDNGYPTRSALLALAIGYDWLYEYLDSSTKADTISTINALYDRFTTGGSPPYAWTGPAYMNYFSGHMLGMGAAADATEGDNPNAAAIYTKVRSLFDTAIASALQPDPVLSIGSGNSSGGFNGGGVPESYNYGATTNIRLWETLLLWKTSGRVDLIPTYTKWMKNSVKNLVYTLRPNRWQAGDEGDMTGNCTGVLSQNYPLFMSYLLSGTTEGAWAEYLFRNMATNPCDGNLTPPASYDAVLWKDANRTATDYSTSLGLNYISDGDGHVLTRSDWSNGALHVSFNASGATFTEHQSLASGNLEIQRGNDYLLVGAAQWKTLNGYGVGNPQIFSRSSQYTNTIYFDDGGAYDYKGGSYVGGQMFWGITRIVSQRADAQVTYALSDLGTAYDRRTDMRVPATRTARYFYRSVAHLGGSIVFVWDRFRASSAEYGKRLQWHLNPANPPSVDGFIISTTKGSSTLFIDTLLPTAPSILVARDIATSNNTSPLTYNIQVSDSVVGTDLNALTVIYATASGGSLPATATIVTDSNWVGAQVADSTPLVAVFAKTVRDNGNNTYTPVTYTSTTFTSTHANPGKYLVAGLQPGTYSVLKDGVALPGYSSVAVGVDGTLFFTSAAGSFSIAWQAPAGASACDLNGDGVVNALDVRLATDQALGNSPCTSADLDRDGKCTVVDVQRVTNAANGQSCRTGQ